MRGYELESIAESLNEKQREYVRRINNNVLRYALALRQERATVTELRAKIKKAERSGDAGPTGEEIGCPWCGEEICLPPGETKHAVGCEAFTPEGEVK